MEINLCTCRLPDLRIFGDMQSCLACGASTQITNTHPSPSSQTSSSSDSISTLSTIGDIEETASIDREATTQTKIDVESNEYIHTKLNLRSGKNIRLIRLYPGGFEDELVCRIYQADLEDSPEYEAISYTWADDFGDRSTSQTLRCPQKILHITSNCAQALRRARHAGFPRTLWVDSICIHQENVRERSHQVSVMNQIYAGASQVLIYAGEPSPCSDRLLDYIGDLRQPRHNHVTPGADAPFNQTELPLVVDRLFSRAWFHRVWVLQEVILAKRALFIIGTKTIDWSLLSKDRLAKLGIRPMLRDGLVPGIFQWMSHQESKVDLLVALHAGRNCLASDPRDKVFALLGLLFDSTSKSIDPNYELSVSEVFIQIAVLLITTGNSLGVLSHVIDNKSTLALPSWVPDWGVETYTEPLKPQLPGLSRAFGHTGWTCREFELKPIFSGQVKSAPTSSVSMELTSALTVIGTKLSSIVHVAGNGYFGEINDFVICTSETDSNERDGNDYPKERLYGQYTTIRNALRLGTSVKRGESSNSRSAHAQNRSAHMNHRCLKKIEFFQNFSRKQFDLSDPICFCRRPYPTLFDTNRVCCCGAHEADKPAVTHLQRFSFPMEIPPSAINPQEEKRIFAQKSTTYDQKAFRVFESEWKAQGHGRCKFETQHSLGFGPPSIQPHDEIWLLQGAFVPFVLRKVDQHYRVIGECYLYGAERLRGCFRGAPEEATARTPCHLHGMGWSEGCGVSALIKLR